MMRPPVHSPGLPTGEEVLWQGAPSPLLLMRSLHIRAVGLYFVALLAWQVASGTTLFSLARSTVLSAAAVGLLALYAFFAARTTRYMLTTRRVIIHAGIALPLRFNIPYERLAGAELRPGTAAGGDIVLLPQPGGPRLGYVVLWPHARPFRFTRPAPMLRALRDAAEPAKLLARAVQAQFGDQLVAGPAINGRPRPHRTPSGDGAALAT